MYKEYFFLYLIYGFVFILMGIFCWREKDKELPGLRIIKSLKFLALFGFIHGMSEWLTLIIIVKLYPDIQLHLYNLNQVLKAISFLFLALFGLDLFPIREKYKKRILLLPVIGFLLYLSGFLLTIAQYGLDYHIEHIQYNIIAMRYAMALPSGILAAIALFMKAKVIANHKSIKMANRYRSLATIFLINGLLEGLFVSQSNFFPANLINKELFMEYLTLPPLYLKVLVGVIIMILLNKVIETFDWEQKERLKRLKKHRIASEERRKLGLEIHDSIIQSLYAAGLKVEYCLINKNEEKQVSILEEIKTDLNQSISKTREFISKSTLELIELEDLISSLQQLINQYNKSQHIQIRLFCETSELHFGGVSSEASTQIYYVVQEAICNVVKHSKATEAKVRIESNPNYLSIEIEDNGIGITPPNDQDSQRHFGISSMQERTKRVGGLFQINKKNKGTEVELKIPWEVLQNGTEDQRTVGG